eukprot:1696538-Rhodomonas_salina.3
MSGTDAATATARYYQVWEKEIMQEREPAVAVECGPSTAHIALRNQRQYSTTPVQLVPGMWCFVFDSGAQYRTPHSTLVPPYSSAVPDTACVTGPAIT